MSSLAHEAEQLVEVDLVVLALLHHIVDDALQVIVHGSVWNFLS